MDIRNYGRSESRGRPEEWEGRDSEDYGAYRREDNRRPVDRGYEERGGRSHSPHIERGFGGGYARNHDGRDSYRPRDDRGADIPPRRHDDGHKVEPEPSRVLGIFGMSKFTNEHNLREIFERYGPIEKIQIIRDPHDGRSRGFAFINMENVEDAQKAREELTGTTIHERRVRVDFSFTTKAHSPTPGKYKGQETGSYGRRDGAYRPRINDRYDSYHAPYHARRRANTRDRRRREYPHRRGHHEQYSRSKSPGFQGSYRPSDSHHRSAPYYADGQGRDYDRRNGYHRSPPRSYAYDAEYDRGYAQRAPAADERLPRNDYRQNYNGNPPY
ncbi:transformer 2 beta [Coemansia sp. RSA 1086]|nr:transformer 2 beta [Coemansia sp. RSA 1086]